MEKKGSGFPFDIEFVIGLDMPDAKRYHSGNRNEIRTDCPFCGKKGKFYLNVVKGTYNCQMADCRAHGGMLELHKELTHLPDRSAALKDLMAAYNNMSPADRQALLVRAEKMQKEDQKPLHLAGIETRNRVYSRMLDCLPLAAEDHADLLRRGLTNQAIMEYKLCSTPVLTHSTAKWMLGKYYKEQSEHFSKYGSDIPGLYPKNGETYIVKMPAGIVIPVLDREGRISMLQVRRRNLPDTASEDEKEGYHKYSQLSSSWKEGGCSTSGISKVHHIGFNFGSEKTPAQVCLTEGALKADVASYLEGGKAYIAVLGVNDVNQLDDEFRWLFAHGTRAIRIRLDMDFYENPAVAKAWLDVNIMLQKLGCTSLVQKYNTQDVEPRVTRFRNLMDAHQIPYTEFDRNTNLNEIAKGKTGLVFNDFWNPKYKGIDDYEKERILK